MIAKENLVMNLELKIQILFEIRKFLFISVLIFTFIKILYNSYQIIFEIYIKKKKFEFTLVNSICNSRIVH
jgi:hypothetical protein